MRTARNITSSRCQFLIRCWTPEIFPFIFDPLSYPWPSKSVIGIFMFDNFLKIQSINNEPVAASTATNQETLPLLGLYNLLHVALNDKHCWSKNWSIAAICSIMWFHCWMPDCNTMNQLSVLIEVWMTIESTFYIFCVHLDTSIITSYKCTDSKSTSKCITVFLSFSVDTFYRCISVPLFLSTGEFHLLPSTC